MAIRMATDAADAYRKVGTAKRILALADMAIVAAGGDGTITDANRSAGEIFGYGEGELIGMSVHLLVPPHLRQGHEAMLRRFMESPENERRMGQRGEVSGYRKDGTFFPLEASIGKFHNGDDWVLVATLRDLTDAKRAEAELTRRATHDPLTGLANRALIRERLESALHRSRRQGSSIALLFIDLDDFKAINDSHGHDVGDTLLKEAAQRLIETVRPGDTVGRLSGDEFVVLCEQVETPLALSALADRLLEVLRQPFALEQNRLFATASIGIAVGHGATHSADDILRSADTAMYAVKEKGRDGWKFFSESLQEEAQRRLSISSGLRTAIEHRELRVLWQPIVNSATGRVEGAELLLRWHPPQGEISPAVFIPVAELTGAIVPIGRWVFEQACLAERAWYARFGVQAPYVSVNLSARQLAEERLLEDFKGILESTEAEPSRIQLEVTETSLMADVTSNGEVLDHLSDLGMRVAVDDFGTGYSSLAQLMRLNVDTLKIDKVFVQGLDRDHESRVIVSALSRIAKSLKLKLVAEGVETSAQRGVVRLLGCEQIQGYYFHRPMPPEDFLAVAETSLRLRLESEGEVYFLIYVSRSKDPTTQQTLDQIQAESNRFNLVNGITGYLFYIDGTFAQYLEGDRRAVRDLYQKIVRDPRHRDATVIAEGTLERRMFTGWAMGLRVLDKPFLAARAHLIEPRGATFDKLIENPAACCNLFEVISIEVN